MWLPVVMYNVETLTEGIKKGHKECGPFAVGFTVPGGIAAYGRPRDSLAGVTHTRRNAGDGDHQRLFNVMVRFQTFLFRFT
ncbi:Uncharacterised protein [Kluyvera cryocrescens]|uniref:Uncharacterized protein n=1 Tax=Kluyvera cryocrescens TaxID=580 RepID=A0A485B6I8_KLUCR|nr:Uncharacterised protein [Kluyvera cryocrescens]